VFCAIETAVMNSAAIKVVNLNFMTGRFIIDTVKL